VTVGLRHRIDDRVDRGEVGVAGVGRRGADGDEQQPRVLERRPQLGGEVQPLAIASDALVEPGFVDRHLAALELRDLLGVDVDAPDIAAELGEPRGGHEADIAGANHGDRFALL
jgi:hypothetical protein